MSALELLENVSFNPQDYEANEWFIEQDSFKLCTYDDKPIDIPVLIISEYTLAHYKYYISICCETNLDEFYECLGNQPLKMVFTHLIDSDYVERHGYNVFPDTNLNRKYTIKNNELYLDSNEIELDIENSQLVGHGDYVLEEDETETEEEETDSEDEDHYISNIGGDNGGDTDKLGISNSNNGELEEDELFEVDELERISL